MPTTVMQVKTVLATLETAVTVNAESLVERCMGLVEANASEAGLAKTRMKPLT